MDPLLTIKYYHRTPEQQAALGFLVDSESAGQHGADDDRDTSLVTRDSPSGSLRTNVHGSVGAVAGHRAIAQGNSEEITAALLKYSAPEEVR